MEESKKYAGQSSQYTSHSLQTSFSPAAESRGSPHTLRMIPSDKLSHQPTSSVAAPASSALGHVSTATPASVQYQLPTSDVRASTVSSGFTSNNLGRDLPAAALPRVERAQFKSDGGPNGSSLALQGQGDVIQTPCICQMKENLACTLYFYYTGICDMVPYFTKCLSYDCYSDKVTLYVIYLQ